MKLQILSTTLLGAPLNLQSAALLHVATCRVFEDGQIWANNTQHGATQNNRVAKRMQHIVPDNVAICCDRLAGA